MPYQYDVFISYRNSQLKKWVRDIFYEILEHHLGEQLTTGEAKIFLDRKDISGGVTWDDALQNALASSKVILPLWSRRYFSRDWCKYELAHMLMRQEECGYGRRSNDRCLIVPVDVTGGYVSFPDYVKRIQCIPLYEYARIYLTKESPKAVELEEQMVKKLVPAVAKAISSAPEYDSKWLDWDQENDRIREITNLISTEHSSQTSAPSLGG